MLRIEKVFLQGFKSFCDPTEVIFDNEGITAVIGPNGCGKSNVADALNWVIGEQRAKALRGGKMEDVIFQGSRNRKPSGLAEVSLTMRVAESFVVRAPEQPKVDQSDTVAPAAPPPPSSIKADLSYAEGDKITIARRLYRTGESEYEMNGRTCRLRDILDLFAGTGLGSAHYAIIEQGRIGQILSAKPLDRRALIEEAAGISKFKLRQRAAELKLEAAKQNLARVSDIIAEVERQQITLKRQAAKARRYQRLRTELRQLTQAVLVGDYQKTQQLLTALEEQRLLVTRHEANCAQRIEQTEKERQQNMAQAAETETDLTAARAAVAETHLQVEKIRQQQIHLTTQIELQAKRRQQFVQESLLITERYGLLEQESNKIREDLQQLESEINQEALALSSIEQSQMQQMAEDERVEKQLEIFQRKVTEAATHRERWHQLVQQYTEAMERNENKLTGLNLEKTRAREQAQKIAADQMSITRQLSQMESNAAALSQEFTLVQETLRQRLTEAKEAANFLQHLQKEATITEQRLKSLIDLDERRAYFSESVQAVIQESKRKENYNFSVYGTLADFIKVSPEDEAMVEVALREELQYLITPSFEDALTAINFLKQEHQGRATFLVLSPPTTIPPPAVKGTHPETTANTILHLIDILGLPTEIAFVIRRALPRLSQTVITSQVQHAIQASISTNGKGNSFLTTEGEFISAGHIITGGSGTEKGTGVLALKREIAALQMKHAQTAEEYHKADKNRVRLEEEVFQLEQIEQTLDTRLRTAEKDLLQLHGKLQQCDRDNERADTHLRVVEIEIQQAELEHNEITTKLQHAQRERNMAEDALSEAEALAATTVETVTQMRLAASQRTQEIFGRRADFAAKSERRRGLQNTLRRQEQEQEDITRRLSRAQQEVDEAEQEVQAQQYLFAQMEAQTHAQQEIYQSQLAETEYLSSCLNEKREQLLQIEAALTELRTTLSQEREQRAEIDISRTRLITYLEHLQTTCQAELNVDLPSLLAQMTEPAEEAESSPLPGPDNLSEPAESETDTEENSFLDPTITRKLAENFDLETGKKYLEELRAKVESIGPVNLLALQELGELEDRLAFLLIQRADIEKAVADTISVITELKKRSRERFVTAFHTINQNFSTMFLELFGGGHAEMRLIDESDVLESGIDIIAQPPGKRLQNVLLLSGGEKAMAALSLVLGIFKYRPSPFCILDEVDAPLDDVNISRFADKILEMSRDTQFLVITHSKRTMEAARTLYGVTMQDPGVSKLISVRLS